MTVCVAALCDGSTIVGASDRMITAGDVQFEPEQMKSWWMNPSIVVMISGDTTLQTEILLGVYAEVADRIRSEPDNWWNVSDVTSLYVRHYNAIRSSRAEDAVLSPLGLTRDTFISRQHEMSASLIERLSSDLLHFDLPQISAIVAGIDPSGAHLWLISKSGRTLAPSCHDNAGFVSIGMGRWHSQSQFMFSGHTRLRPFPETLLLTYSAKKRAEVAPGVGSGTDMFLITALGRSVQSVSGEVLKDLNKIYRKERQQAQAATSRAIQSATHYISRLLQEEMQRTQNVPAVDDGLVAIKLAKGYGDHKAGETMRVDPVRAAWLREHGYEESA